MKVSLQHINLDSHLTLTMLDSKILVKIKKGIWIRGLSFTHSITTPKTIFAIWHTKGHCNINYYILLPYGTTKVVIINRNNYYYKGLPHTEPNISLFSRTISYIYIKHSLNFRAFKRQQNIYLQKENHGKENNRRDVVT